MNHVSCGHAKLKDLWSAIVIHDAIYFKGE